MFPIQDPPRGLDERGVNPEPREATLAALAARYPHLIEMATATAAHARTTGVGCDAQLEFEFALDVLLDGVERLHQQNWTP